MPSGCISVSVKPAAGGRNAAGARHCRVLRNDPALEPQIRCDLRKAIAQKGAVAKGYLASGRGGRDDRRSKALALASRRPGWIVLDEIVQLRRDTKAAKRLLIRLLKKQGLAQKRIVTGKLHSKGRQSEM